MHRGILQTSCGIGSKIMIKQNLIPTEYPNEIYFYEMKEERCSNDMDSFSCGLIFRQ